MSTWLSYGSQLFSQTLIKVFLWRYFENIVNIYSWITLSKWDHPQKCGWASSSQLKALTKTGLPEKKEFWLKTARIQYPACISTLSGCPTNFWFVSACHCISQFLKINLSIYLYLYVLLVLFLLRTLTDIVGINHNYIFYRSLTLTKHYH